MSTPIAKPRADLSAALGSFLAARLRGEVASQPKDLAQALGSRPGHAFLCVRAHGKQLAQCWGNGAHQWASLQAALAQLQRQLDPSRSAAATTLEVCLTEPAEAADPRSDRAWRALNANVDRGIRGVEFAWREARERTSPLTMITTNRNVERLLQLFVQKHSVPLELVRGGVSIRTFAAEQFLIVLGTDGVRTIPLVRGARYVSPAEIDPPHVRELASLLGDFLLNNLHPDGRMTYLYYPSREEEDTSQNNMIRQWMATIALCRLAQGRLAGPLAGSPLDEGGPAQDLAAGARRTLAMTASALFELAAANIRYNLTQFYRKDGKLGLILYQNEVKLGAVALAALALMSHPNRAEYADTEASLFATIHALWQETGEFRTFYQPRERHDMQDYYPGEALLAWVHRWRETRDPDLYRRIHRSFRYYRHWHLQPANRRPAFVPWHTQAYALLWRETRDPELAQFVFEMNDWLVPVQQWPMPDHPEFAGRFHDPGRPFGPPHASATGVYLEGLADAYQMAISLADAERQERYRLAICRGIRSLSQLVFRDEADLCYIQQRERVRGGVRTTTYDNIIRVDNVQHGLLALLKVLEGFHPADVSCVPLELPEDPSALISTEAPLQVYDQRVLSGANAFLDQTAVTCGLTWGGGVTSGARFHERLGGLLPDPTWEEALESVPEDGWTPEGSEVARWVALTATALHRLVDCLAPATVTEKEQDSERHVVAIATEYPEVGSRALGLAASLVSSALASASDAQQVPPSRLVAAFVRFAQGFLPPMMRRDIARVARARRIPCWRVRRAPDVFRLGTGHWQKSCDLTTTSNTPMVDAAITSNKPVSNPLFRRLGVPMAEQLVASTADEAVAAARRIGYPVVVKPWSGSGGSGVSANLVNAEQVREAFARAANLRGNKVAVEEFLPGEDYRFLIIGGEFVSACRRIPPHVIGDGEHTVTELVHAVNRTRDRADGYWHTLHAYELDTEAIRVLKGSGYAPESVPAADERVVLSSAANGGTTADVTTSVHPDNIATAERAARIAGIDVCGIDFLLPDPTRSYRETGGGICEVNYQPSPLVHIIADGGCSLAVVERFIEFLIPRGRDGRIPVAVLLDARGEAHRIAAGLLGLEGVARATSDLVHIGAHEVAGGLEDWPRAVHMALLDPAARCALLAPTRAQILRQGLVVDWCDVAVLADPVAPSDLAARAVLRGASTFVAWSTALIHLPPSGEGGHARLIACSLAPGDAALRHHGELGGRAVFVDERGHISALDGRSPRTLGMASHGVLADAVLGAATAWALGASLDDLALRWEQVMRSGGHGP